MMFQKGFVIKHKTKSESNISIDQTLEKPNKPTKSESGIEGLSHFLALTL